MSRSRFTFTRKLSVRSAPIYSLSTCSSVSTASSRVCRCEPMALACRAGRFCRVSGGLFIGLFVFCGAAVAMKEPAPVLGVHVTAWGTMAALQPSTAPGSLSRHTGGGRRDVPSTQSHSGTQTLRHYDRHSGVTTHYRPSQWTL